MTIYFTASIIGKKQFLANYEQIIQYLKNQHHTVISDHILLNSEDKIKHETVAQRHQFHAQLDTWIQSSDCVIAEASFPSISVGFEIALAASKNKPVLVLYTGSHSPTILLDRDDNVVCESYTQSNYQSIIDDFINYCSDDFDTRITFFLPKKLHALLEQNAKEKNISKSAFLRKLIESQRNN